MTFVSFQQTFKSQLQSETHTITGVKITMRTIRTKVYQFDELTPDAQQKAIENFRYNSNDYEFVWDNIREDAKEIGLKIISLDDHRPNEGEFHTSGINTAKRILENHGKSCETYKTASDFLAECKAIEDKAKLENKDGDEEYWYDDEIEELESEFLKSLLEDYRIMYNNDIDYQNSDETIKETIEENEYEFTSDGRMI